MERLVRVKVVADARKDSLRENGKGGFEMSVREPAAENRANERVRELLAAHFGVPVKSVRITAGHQRPTKTVRIG